jgi:glycine cleavage system H lipoate-binding protein
MMQEPVCVDLFATKGMEYVLVIVFLGALMVFWRLLNRPGRLSSDVAAPRHPVTERHGWFELPRERFYHPGHSWALPDAGGVVTVGIDDFGQKLIGVPDSVDLPAVGTAVGQGERGWAFQVDSKTVDLVSPVDGEVVARNEAVVEKPDLINCDPYGEGWLLKVRATRMQSNLRGLLRDKLVDAWMETTEADLRRRMTGNLGTVLQDGGVPVLGIARALAGNNWHEIAKDFLLTS